MKIALIHEGDFGCCALQSPGTGQAAKSRSKDHDARQSRIFTLAVLLLLRWFDHWFYVAHLADLWPISPTWRFWLNLPAVAIAGSSFEWTCAPDRAARIQHR